MQRPSAFITVDRAHNTPGVLVASNNENSTRVVNLRAAQIPGTGDGPEDGAKRGHPSIHITQKRTGVTVVWGETSTGGNSSSFTFNLAPHDELWASASAPVVVWVLSDPHGDG